MVSAEQQLALLHSFLADYPRPAGMAVSDHIHREAKGGNTAAKCLLASGLFTGVGNDAEAPLGAAPARIVPPAVQERERRIVSQPPRRKELPPARRSIVQTCEVRPWLPK